MRLVSAKDARRRQRLTRLRFSRIRANRRSARGSKAERGFPDDATPDQAALRLLRAVSKRQGLSQPDCEQSALSRTELRAGKEARRASRLRPACERRKRDQTRRERAEALR